MKKKGKLTKAERFEISILLTKGYSQRAVSRALDRSPNTVSYEIKENSTNGIYDPIKAHNKALADRSYRRLDWKKLDSDPPLRELVISRLKLYWNPDEISGWLKKNKKIYVSKTAIYEWLYSVRGQAYCKYLYSNRYGRRKHRPKTEQALIPYRISITERPRGAENRSRYGHMEADTIVSRKGSGGAILSCIDRKSRYVRLEKLSGMKPSETKEKILSLKHKMNIRSISFDNGIENREHHLLGVSTYFCDPYTSWQKGSIENANKLVRRFLPKKTNLSLVTEEQIKYIERIINNKPRKILGYRSAKELAEKFLLKVRVS